MEDRREIINPHDKMTIDFSDQEAAILAVFAVGNGRYGIVDKTGEDGMPLFVFGGFRPWYADRFGASADDQFDNITGRVIIALRSWRLEGERSSMSDPTSLARKIADQLERLPAP